MLDITSMWKYPRECGEEGPITTLTPTNKEIPPRVRGRVIQISYHPLAFGNTPASAGKSSGAAKDSRDRRKYPRECGEE